MASKKVRIKNTQEFSEDTKTIVTVLLLIFAFPAGFILMWTWPKWPKWVKILITIPLIVFIVLILFLSVFLIKNAGKIQKELKLKYYYSATSSPSFSTY